MHQMQLEQLLYEALETEMGGVKVYDRALQCVQNPQLREEWQKYHQQTQRHVQIVRGICSALGLDPMRETPGRLVVRTIGDALVKAIELARSSGNPAQAEIVAAEAVTEAELKDHLNWQLLGLASKEADERTAKLLKDAYDQVEDEEDEHFYHSKGWARELYAKSLGIDTVLPPPEEKLNVKSAFGAAMGEKARRLM